MKDWWEVRQCLQVVALENLDCIFIICYILRSVFYLIGAGMN